MQTLKGFKVELDKIINDSSQVFLVPHLGADFDAIASCIGMSLIVRKLRKRCYIIFDEDPVKIEPGVKKIVDDMKEYINIIPLSKFDLVKTDNDLLITLDVNKGNLICCEKKLSLFKDIVVIDHHKIDEATIKSSLSFIDISVSSVSEVMVELLCLYSIRYDNRIANYLLAGIYLDTNRFTKNVSSKTMRLVSKLLNRGANLTNVNELFEEDFVSDRKVQGLVSKANFFTYTIATCIADDSITYTKEELAKVADYLLKYKVDAAFSVGFIDEELISISARSKGKIDVGEIMKEMGGGGNIYSAATKIEIDNISNVSNKLVRKIKPSFYQEEL